jgi:hypothetical protein
LGVRFAPGGFGRICEDPPIVSHCSLLKAIIFVKFLGVRFAPGGFGRVCEDPPIVSHCSLLKAIRFVKFWGCASRLAALAASVKIPPIVSHGSLLKAIIFVKLLGVRFAPGGFGRICEDPPPDCLTLFFAESNNICEVLGGAPRLSHTVLC